MYPWEHEDQSWMRLALLEAEKALLLGEIPVGAVLVRDGQLIAQGHNFRETAPSALGHAEIDVIQKACASLGSWRLDGCQLYVTLEPCAMCAGAIRSARIQRVVFGAFDPQAGCCGSVANLFAMPFPSPEPRITSGVLEQEATQLLRRFFSSLRDKDTAK